MKQCKKCSQSKPFDEFYSHDDAKDGYLNHCKQCTRERVKKYRVKNYEKCRQYKKRYDAQARLEQAERAKRDKFRNDFSAINKSSAQRSSPAREHE